MASRTSDSDFAHHVNWPVPGVKAVYTCRHGGVSRKPFDSLNLSLMAGDEALSVEQNRASLVRRLRLPSAPVWLRQVHGNDVIDCSSPAQTEREADGSWTDRQGVVLAVLTADCLPVLLSSEDGEVVAVAHAGWRGMAAGILHTVVKQAGLQPGFHAWLGPCIRPPHYQVGDDVREAFEAQLPEAGCAFTREGEGQRWQLDLARAATQVLLGLGGQVVDSGLDTWREDFFSYRQSHPTGRQACLIWKT